MTNNEVGFMFSTRLQSTKSSSINGSINLQLKKNDFILKKIAKKIVSLVKEIWNFTLSIFYTSPTKAINSAVILPRDTRISLEIRSERRIEVEQKEEIERKVEIENLIEKNLPIEEYVKKTAGKFSSMGVEIAYNYKLKEWIRKFEENFIGSNKKLSKAVLINVSLFKRNTESFIQELQEGVSNCLTYSLTSRMKWLLREQNQEILKNQVEEELALHFDQQEKKVVFEHVDLFLTWIFACKNESIEIEAIKKNLLSQKLEPYMFKVREVIFDQLINNQIDRGIKLIQEKRSFFFSKKVVLENTEKIGDFLANRLIALIQKIPFPKMIDDVTEIMNKKVEENLQPKKDISKKDISKKDISKKDSTKQEVNTKNEVEAKEHCATLLQKELRNSCLKIFHAIFPSTWKQQNENFYEVSGISQVLNTLQMSEDHEKVIGFFKEMEEAIIDQNKTNGKSLLHHILLSVSTGFKEQVLSDITQSTEKNIQKVLSKQGINYFSSTVLFPHMQIEIAKEFVKKILLKNADAFSSDFLSEEVDRLESLCDTLYKITAAHSTFLGEMNNENFREISLPIIKEMDQLLKNQLKNRKASQNLTSEQIKQYLKEAVKEKENQKENQTEIDNKVYWDLFYNITFKLGHCGGAKKIVVKCFETFISKMIFNGVEEVRKDYSKVTRLGCDTLNYFYGKRSEFEELIFAERTFPSKEQLEKDAEKQIHTTAKLLYDFIVFKATFKLGFFNVNAGGAVTSVKEIENILKNIYGSLTDPSFLNENLFFQIEQCIIEHLMSSAKTLRKEKENS